MAQLASCLVCSRRRCRGSGSCVPQAKKLAALQAQSGNRALPSEGLWALNRPGRLACPIATLSTLILSHKRIRTGGEARLQPGAVGIDGGNHPHNRAAPQL